jgi:uncharacterized protein YjiS (DUF1127 family)
MLLGVLMKKGWAKVKTWREISRQRSQLRRMSEFLAKDIGLSRAEVEREADRPFWDYKQERPASSRPLGVAKEQTPSAKHNCCLQP